MRKRRNGYESTSHHSGRAGLQVAGLAHRRARALFLYGRGVAVAVAHCVDSAGRFLAKTGSIAALRCEAATGATAARDHAAAVA